MLVKAQPIVLGYETGAVGYAHTVMVSEYSQNIPKLAWVT